MFLRKLIIQRVYQLHRFNMILSSQLKTYLKNESGWVSGGKLERIPWTNHKTKGTYKPSYVSRELRHLEENKEIQKKMFNDTVFYRHLFRAKQALTVSKPSTPTQSTFLPKTFVYDRT